MIVETKDKTIKINTISSLEKIVEKKWFRPTLFGVKVTVIEYFPKFTNKDEFLLDFKTMEEMESAYEDLNAKFKKFNIEDAYHEKFVFSKDQKTKLDKRCINFANEIASFIASNWQGECYINDEAKIYLAKQVEFFTKRNKAVDDEYKKEG